MTLDRSVADDVVQEAFLGLTAHLDSVERPEAYLQRSVVNLSIQVVRRRTFEMTDLVLTETAVTRCRFRRRPQPRSWIRSADLAAYGRPTSWYVGTSPVSPLMISRV